MACIKLTIEISLEYFGPFVVLELEIDFLLTNVVTIHLCLKIILI